VCGYINIDVNTSSNSILMDLWSLVGTQTIFLTIIEIIYCFKDKLSFKKKKEFIYLHGTSYLSSTDKS